MPSKGQSIAELYPPAALPHLPAKGPASGESLSVVIPVGPADGSWKSLLRDLKDLMPSDEAVFSAAESEPREFLGLASQERLRCRVAWLCGPAGRAAQMNRGARAAIGSHLWFVHCDSRLSPDSIAALRRSIEGSRNGLHYFQIRFEKPRPWLMFCNELGVTVRSRVFRMPFGDQALCLRKGLFFELGAFDEAAPYGEDHLLVWEARRRRVPLRWTGATIATSSRRYLTNGWAATTLRHGWLTWKQAAAEACLPRSRR